MSESFSGNLKELFAQLASSTNNNNQSPFLNEEINISNRPRAIDYFDSSDDEIDDDEENYQEMNDHSRSIPNQQISPKEEIQKKQEEKTNKNENKQNLEEGEFIWVEKTESEIQSYPKTTGKRKRSYEDKKRKKKRKLEKEEKLYSKKSSKKKLKEKEKLLKLEEKILKQYGSIARSSNYQWGTIKKDSKTGNMLSVKENPLKSDNEIYYWDTKPDKDLLMYERIYSNSIPSYYHAPKRFLGLKKHEIAKYLRQHQTYIISNNDQISSKKSERYFYKPLLVKKSNFKKSNQIKSITLSKEDENKLKNEDFLDLQVLSSVKSENNDVDVDDEKEENIENYIMEKTKEFNQETQKNPKNIQKWKEFIDFQDEIQKLNESFISEKSVLEKKMSIYLSALQINEDSEELLLGYLSCCEKLWDSEKLLTIWDTVIQAKKSSISMWFYYLQFRLSHFHSFSISDIRAVFLRAISSMFDLQIQSSHCGDLHRAIQAEEFQVEFFRRYCLFEAQCGYFERAVALYQAMIEFNFNYPKHLEEYNERIKIFEAFWDSESPRIGEENAKGWKYWLEDLKNKNQNQSSKQDEQMKQPTLDTEYEKNVNHLLKNAKNHDENIQDDDSFKLKLLEENLLNPLWQPKRSHDMLDDSGMFFFFFHNYYIKKYYIIPFSRLYSKK